MTDLVDSASPKGVQSDRARNLSSHLHFVQALDPLRGGGMGASVIELHQAMRSLGAESMLLSTSNDREAGRHDGTVLVARSGPDRLFYSRDLLAVARRHIRDDTVVHGHGFYVYPSLVVPTVARLHGRPLVTHPHGMLEPWAMRRSRTAKRVARALFENRNARRTALWRALTTAEADQIRAQGSHAPIVVVPNGVDATVYHPGDLRTPEPTMLFLGRLHPKKGLGMLLNAWHGANPGAGGWRLIIAGPDEANLRESLERVVGDRGMASTVEFVGEVRGKEKLDLLRSAWAFVLPSYSEGLPVGVLEAMASGLPVIVTRQCNLPEVEDRSAGILCDAATEDLTLAIRSMTEMDRSSLEAMGVNARRWAETEFAWPTIASTLLDACEEHLA